MDEERRWAAAIWKPLLKRDFFKNDPMKFSETNFHSVWQ